MQQWVENVDVKVSGADGKVVAIRRLLTKFEDQNASQPAELVQVQRISDDLEKEKQVALKLELAHEEEKQKRQLEYQNKILSRKMQSEKSIETPGTKLKQVSNVELPKLTITKFIGNYADWLPFLNTFKAEIDSLDLPPVSKFGFLKELLEPKVRAHVDRLPFTTERYQSPKNILKTE